MFNQLLQPDLRLMIAEGDNTGMAEFCAVLHPAAVAEVLEGLPPLQVWDVLSHSSLEKQVEIFEYVALPQQVELVDVLDRERLSKLIEAMSSDDRVDVLSRMDPDHVEKLLPLVAAAERADIRRLLAYPEDSAGSIMTTEYASLPEEITVREAIQRLRQQAPDRETIYLVFILGDGRRLDGIVSLRDLILARPDARLADVMNRDVISVRVDDDQEQVAQLMARYDFLVVPVVDDRHQLVGIITHDDVMDVVTEEADEDAQRMGAIDPILDDYLDTPLLAVARKRGGWLMFLAVVALGTAQILHFFEGSGGEEGWMIMFLPLVLASGGNAGSQSATLIIRYLATTEPDRRKYGRLVTREFCVGLVLGGCLAAIGFTAAAVWFQMPLVRAVVVGVTVYVVVILGAVIGGLFPITFERLGMDPAIMSTPLISAIVDVMGVVIYYTIAHLAPGALAA
jgi:magnesium transporter